MKYCSLTGMKERKGEHEHKTQRIELSYCAAAEAVSRIIIDNDYLCELAVSDSTDLILAAIGFKRGQKN